MKFVNVVELHVNVYVHTRNKYDIWYCNTSMSTSMNSHVEIDIQLQTDCRVTKHSMHQYMYEVRARDTCTLYFCYIYPSIYTFLVSSQEVKNQNNLCIIQEVDDCDMDISCYFELQQ